MIHHFVHAQAWNEVEALLTDLQFIQARFEAGQGHDLLAEYDTVLKAHPEQDEEFKQQIEQDAALHKYVQAIVDYSRRCSAIRKRREHPECYGRIAEIQRMKMNMPDPPDTRNTINEMRCTSEEARIDKPSVATRFERIREFQQFVGSRFHLLVEAPTATIDIARNHAQTGIVAEAARKLEPSRLTSTRLLRSQPQDAHELHPLVIRSIDGWRIYDFGPDTRKTWMTPDARFAFIGGSPDGDAVIDLRTGRDLTSGFSRAPLAISLDGRWIVLHKKHDEDRQQLSLLDSTSGRVVAFCDDIQLSWSIGFMDQCGITPDGSLVVIISRFDPVSGDFGSNFLVTWNTQVQVNNVHTIPLDDFEPTELVLSHSGAFVAINGRHNARQDEFGSEIDEGRRWKVLDLLERQECLDVAEEEFTCDSVDGWHTNDFLSACSVRSARQTADSRVQIGMNATVLSHTGEVLRQLDGHVYCLDAITADGRFAMAQRKDEVCILDLAYGRSDRASANSAASKTNPTGGGNLDDPSFCGDDLQQLAREHDVTIKVNPYRSSEGSDETRAEMVLCQGKTNQWAMPGAIRSGSWELAPDMSVLVAPMSATNPFDQPLNAQSDLRVGSAAALLDLATGDEIRIEFPGWCLGFTPDARAVVFGQFCNNFAEFDRLRFWCLKTRDWLEISRYSESCFYDVVARSPDGRRLVLSTAVNKSIVSFNNDDNKVLKRRYVDDGGCWVNWRAFSLDAEFLLEHLDGETRLWSTEDFSLIGVDSMPRRRVITPEGKCWIDWQGVARDSRGQDLGIKIDAPKPGPCWVTASRAYHIEKGDHQLVSSTDSMPVPLPGQRLPGVFDDKITFSCRQCGRRSVLPPEVIEAVNAIHEKFGIGPTSVPSLELVDDAWEKGTSLNFPCLICGHPHRSTPFYIDRRPS